MSYVQQQYYDIESLNNVFSLCNYRFNENIVDVYILCDDALDTQNTNNIFVITAEIMYYITARIRSKNKNFSGIVNYYDLHDYDANIHLINTFGAKDADGTFERLSQKDKNLTIFVNDTDIGYSDQKNAYLMGYNSFNYDTTELSLYINDAFWLDNGTLNFKSPTARLMRDYNNDLFSPKYKEQMPSYLKRQKRNDSNSGGYANRENVIRSNMLKSGRHVDVARLNEKMQKVAFKRVLGMLGYQILESDKLDNKKATLETLDELADLIAYNVSDVVNLKVLFDHPVYQGNFELKKGLLRTYPELIYNQKKVVDKNTDTRRDEYLYEPDIRPDNVRYDRLFVDSSSAMLAAKTLCPYGVLNDTEVVSFLYPSEEKAKKLGIPRVNVLDECYKFFHNLYPNNSEVTNEFDRIYTFYKNNIEGRNFNASDEYAAYWKANNADGSVKPAYSMDEIPKCDLTLVYYNKDGSPSNCYITFGIGGIHGAEYNQALYDADMQKYQKIKELHDTVRALYPEPTTLKQKNGKKVWSFSCDDIEYKASEFLKSGSTQNKAEWKDIEKKKPMLFKKKDNGSYELNKKYTFTSVADCNHEDFTSYYPNLLIMMDAFYNKGLGYDRYAEIFEDKQRYGKLMKDKTISKDERNHYDIMRNGTKLILNSASGAADAAFFTPIRMNNQIMSMRIIGQLFTWRIGQAQTYEGACIISTNTDGLFSVFEPVKNAEILEREAANINVEIEPEFCRLISKDSNNRMELNKNGDIITASGGSLACYKRPNPTKSLAHAAIIDWALCEYLRNVDNIHKNMNFISEDFDLEKGRYILSKAKNVFVDLNNYLNMFQTIISSSIGSQTYVFGETNNLQGYKHFITTTPFNKGLFNAACESDDIKIMSHYNRAFFVNMEYQTIYQRPVYRLKNAVTRVVTPASRLTRRKDNQLPIQHDDYALAVLEKYNVDKNDIPSEKEAKITKLNGIDLDWNVFIENHSLSEISDDEKRLLVYNLDMEKYLTLIADSFNKNWKNVSDKEETEEDQNGDAYET